MFRVGFLQASQSSIHVISINSQSIFCLFYGKTTIHDFLYAMIQQLKNAYKLDIQTLTQTLNLIEK